MVTSFYYDQFFSYDQVNELLEKGLAIDARQGGLLIGPAHGIENEAGIKMLFDCGYGYQLQGEAEGYEYIFNVATGYLIRNLFDTWNNYDEDYTADFQEYMPPAGTKIINTILPSNSLYLAKFILAESRGVQKIINKYSTKKHLKIMDEANQKFRGEYNDESFFLASKINVIDTVTNELVCSQDLIWRK